MKKLSVAVDCEQVDTLTISGAQVAPVLISFEDGSELMVTEGVIRLTTRQPVKQNSRYDVVTGTTVHTTLVRL